jgi:drug/metabolite transporter (DMT)-like permease
MAPTRGVGWLAYGGLSSLAFGAQDTISYELLEVDKIGSAAVNTTVHVLFAVGGLLGALALGKHRFLRDVRTILSKYSLWISLAGACALAGNVLLYWAYQLGSHVNPGVITTIGNGAVVVSTLLAYLVYGAPVTPRQLVGMTVMLVAFTMAAMGNSILGHKQSKHKHGGHNHSEHKHGGHKHGGHKHGGHKHGGHKHSGHKHEDSEAPTDYLPFEPHPYLLTADDEHSGHKHADHKHADHKHADHKRADHKHADHKHADHKHADHKHADHKRADHKHADHKHADHKHADHKHADGGARYGWVAAAVASAVAYGGLSFFQYVITRKDRKLDMMSLALCVALIESIIGLGIYAAAGTEAFSGVERGPFKNYRQDIKRLAGTKYLPYTASTALCDGAGLASLLKSYTLAGNPGFSDVISDTYSMVQGILTYIVYGKKMDAVQTVSLAVAVAGAALISVK